MADRSSNTKKEVGETEKNKFSLCDEDIIVETNCNSVEKIFSI